MIQDTGHYQFDYPSKFLLMTPESLAFWPFLSIRFSKHELSYKAWESFPREIRLFPLKVFPYGLMAFYVPSFLDELVKSRKTPSPLTGEGRGDGENNAISSSYIPLPFIPSHQAWGNATFYEFIFLETFDFFHCDSPVILRGWGRWTAEGHWHLTALRRDGELFLFFYGVVD